MPRFVWVVRDRHDRYLPLQPAPGNVHSHGRLGCATHAVAGGSLDLHERLPNDNAEGALFPEVCSVGLHNHVVLCAVWGSLDLPG